MATRLPLGHIPSWWRPQRCFAFPAPWPTSLRSHSKLTSTGWVRGSLPPGDVSNAADAVTQGYRIACPAFRDGLRVKLGPEQSPGREGNSGRQSWEQYGNIEQAKTPQAS